VYHEKRFIKYIALLIGKLGRHSKQTRTTRRK
jgi:hypothetical protein